MASRVTDLTVGMRSVNVLPTNPQALWTYDFNVVTTLCLERLYHVHSFRVPSGCTLPKLRNLKINGTQHLKPIFAWAPRLERLTFAQCLRNDNVRFNVASLSLWPLLREVGPILLSKHLSGKLEQHAPHLRSLTVVASRHRGVPLLNLAEVADFCVWWEDKYEDSVELAALMGPRMCRSIASLRIGQYEEMQIVVASTRTAHFLSGLTALTALHVANPVLVSAVALRPPPMLRHLSLCHPSSVKEFDSCTGAVTHLRSLGVKVDFVDAPEPVTNE